ncbi:hypothetical protein [Paraburkholderia oxyphila]|uniref:hypothetical protein n=1 Tax=Paraburkholderia oxyphila TaxID=614212 RepID=UPI000483E05F|nr:hypothetical protein [Paraburkholderia oxyphila]
MRRSKLILGAALAAVACASGAAHAARVGVAIGVGVPFGAPYYYPVAPYYYAPAPVIVAPPPAPDYVEQGQPQAQAPGGDNGANDDTWYYCDASKTYYPYVKQCSSGWRAVPAQPAPSN